MSDTSRRSYLLGALFRVPFERIALEVNLALQQAGFTDIRPTHQSVFQHLPLEGARVTDLAEAGNMTKQSMGALIDYLQEHGYLQRLPDPHDKRAQLIQRTPRGWQVEQVARARITQLEAEWAAQLGQEEFARLYGLLQRLVAVLERGDGLPDATEGRSPSS